MPGQRGLDFAEFDAVAADLDLLIGAAEILQLPVGTPAHQVPGAIHALSSVHPRRRTGTPRTARRVSSARPRYPTPTPAPATYNSPTTPAGTGRNHASSTNNAAAGTGEPIGTTLLLDPRAPRPRSQRRTDRHTHRGLGRAVGVDHHPPRRPPLHHLGRAGLADHHQRRRLQPLGRQQRHRRRCLGQHVDLFAHQQRVEVLR